MANLPETNLTANWDASESTGNLYSGITGGVPSGTVAADAHVQVWKSKVNADHVWDASISVTRATPASMLWRNDTTLFRPSIQVIKGTYECKLASNLNGVVTSAFHANNAKTLAISFLLTGKSKLVDSATPYLTTAFIGNPDNNYYGLWLKNASGTVTLYGYNWDGSADTVSFTNLAVDHPYVAILTHNGTNLIMSLYDADGQVGSTQSTASGNTTDIATVWAMCDSNQAFTEQAEVRLGEIATYNAALSGGTLTQLTTYMRDKWLAAASSGGHGKGQGGNHGGGKAIVVISRHRRTERRRK